MSKTEFLNCRVTPEILKSVNEHCKAEQISKTEWLENAIAKALGKRPRVPLASRVAKLEKLVDSLGIE